MTPRRSRTLLAAAAPARRPRRPARHRLLRPVLGAALIVAGVVTPIGSEDLPAVVQELAGETPALAQGPPRQLTMGMEDPCPNTPIQWTANGANCEIETAACAKSPVSGVFLQPSITLGHRGELDLYGNVIDRYPGFCEERHPQAVTDQGGPNAAIDPSHVANVAYESCRNVKGFVVLTHEMELVVDDQGDTVTDAGGNDLVRRMCRIIGTPGCVVGLHRTGSSKCRAVKRRTWTCPADTTLGNEFNTCWAAPPPHAGLHPACGAGAPELIVQRCEDYVGDDYAIGSASPQCGSYKLGAAHLTMSTNTLSGSSSDFWCEFDTAFLKVACHRRNPPSDQCAQTTAHCLKRASGTGGCDAIAKTIRCRMAQAAYDEGGLDLADVRDEGCEPCVLLPFETVSRARCAADVWRQPAVGGHRLQYLFDALFAARQSIDFTDSDCRNVRQGGDINHPDNEECKKRLTCEGGPRGSLTWKSAHHSDVAVVNSPVILTISGVPADTMPIPYATYDRPRNRFDVQIRDRIVFGDDSLGERAVRIWSTPDPQGSYGRFGEFFDTGSFPSVCLFQEAPQFRVMIEELWPDSSEDYNAILDLFGPESLGWWETLSTDERRRLTEARGLQFLEDLQTQADRDLEIEERSRTRTEPISCNARGTAWCRWLPTRSGYFRAVGAAAWINNSYSPRRWQNRDLSNPSRSHLVQLNVFLASNSQHVQSEMEKPDPNLTAAQLGLNAGLTAYVSDLPHQTPGLEWLYTEEAAQQARCPATDLRVSCAGGREAGNYTETAPVGIQVHEIRVATRAPNTP